MPPLKVPSDIVDPRMVPGYGNVDDYLPDDVHYDLMEVQIHKYEYGKPLVKDEKSLTTMMQRLHDWYLKICGESRGGVQSTPPPRLSADFQVPIMQSSHQR